MTTDQFAIRDLESLEPESQLDWRALAQPLGAHWRAWTGAIALSGVLGVAGSYLITPEFTSTTTFLPPQQQSSSATALASLGALAGLAGSLGGGVKSSADQYVSLMQSVTASDRMIDRFKLMTVYETRYRRDARKVLAEQTRMVVGKKDGLISVSVDDEDPRRAAEMANQYVEELRRMTAVLAITEAQQRRVFFEKQMQETKNRLVGAQSALQGSGFTPGAINAEPRAAAEQYAQLRAQATAADVKLQTLRSSLAETAPEVRQQATLVEALRAKLAQLESASIPAGSSPDYIGKYREFKYQETLFDILAKQYELARVDEAREGSLVQVVDPALPAELKSKPKRAFVGAACAFIGALLSGAWLILRARRRAAAQA